LIIDSGRSAIGTIVERSSRSTLLVHLPRLAGCAETPPLKRPLARRLRRGGHERRTDHIDDATARAAAQDPHVGPGQRATAHAQFALETGTKVYFADPHSPWQRPTNENTNGLLRRYFPKGTDLSRWSAKDLEAAALALNNRPR
jgi:transposase, IS30 family